MPLGIYEYNLLTFDTQKKNFNAFSDRTKIQNRRWHPKLSTFLIRKKRFRTVLKLAINHNTKKVTFFHSSIIHQHRAEIFSQSTRIELDVLLNPEIRPRVIVNQIQKKFIEKNDFSVELD